MPFSRRHLLAVVAALLSLSALLGIGVVQRGEAVLLRGLPDRLPEPIPAGGATLGVNVALEHYSPAELEATLEAIAGLGIPVVKQSFYFTSDFDWAAAEQLVDAVAAHPQLTLIPLLDGDPETDFAPPNLAAFSAWSATFAARFGEHIPAYIIWDEPNLTTHWGSQPISPVDYAALLSASASAIRQVDPDALIVMAPLAPTRETGPLNLTETSFLQQVYAAGAGQSFDVVAGKPYGFDTSPSDRLIEPLRQNFSRIITLREVMEANGDDHKAVWAGNWGWNSLPAGWNGDPSIWGQTDPKTQIEHLVAGVERAKREWPWMGLMFAQHWETGAAPDDSQRGFDLAVNPFREGLSRLADSCRVPQPIPPPPPPADAPPAELPYQAAPQLLTQCTPAYTGFHFAAPDHPAQAFVGGWEFSPGFGADISEVAEGKPLDSATFTFWGTRVGLRVRQANFRARLYVSIDGQPANRLPQDSSGAFLVLTAADPNEDRLETVLVADNLEPGVHTLELRASRGWDQWALNGFSVAYRPDRSLAHALQWGLGILALLLGGVALWLGRSVSWAFPGLLRLAQRQQLLTTAVLAGLAALAGWLTWGASTAGLYRRLGDEGQLGLIAATALFFYITPWFYVYLVARLCLFVLIVHRPAWGLALVAFCFPFYVLPTLKPVFTYRFSPLEIFSLVSFAAVCTAWLLRFQDPAQRAQFSFSTALHRWEKADWGVGAFTLIATLSLLFTERLDVATNEWRLVILEPALFYAAFRLARPTRRELWVIIDCFVLSGLVVAGIGLWQYATGDDLITAEGGILRLRSIYGSPNNVALYLGRILPLLLATVAFSWRGIKRPLPLPATRRWLYGLAAVPLLLALLLSFSRGALLLGVPGALLTLLIIWLKRQDKLIWPWVVGSLLLAGVTYVTLLQIPIVAGRLDLRSATGVFRLNLWQSSLEMIRENPLFGVGLDNFLYAYRGRYILDSAWQEPDLSHPHNIFFDFATRVGLLGLVAGAWLFWLLGRRLQQAVQNRGASRLAPPERLLAIGLLAGFVHMLAHGLVDHSFFLVDLAFVFYFYLAVAEWLVNRNGTGSQS